MRKVILIFLSIFFAISSIALITYYYTKDAYYSVGRNDGLIEANAGTLKRLAEIVKVIPACTEEQQREGQNVVAIKAEAVHAVYKGSATITLCLAH
ncbi:hypothetical protein [Acidovorax sp. Leaf78]|uniref:hypothetical protein n=1 Tax=unclassified Acidovorax TaxID=2684926 RepID=UPI0010F3B9A3|nr:hypothetical protein [Acidovorax sp. Leaf78]RYH49622.1 MAG: hypothetical protein EON54_15835 [Alcaligenaceae bacterium]